MTIKEKLEALKKEHRCICGASQEEIMLEKEIDDIISKLSKE